MVLHRWRVTLPCAIAQTPSKHLVLAGPQHARMSASTASGRSSSVPSPFAFEDVGMAPGLPFSACLVLHRGLKLSTAYAGHPAVVHQCLPAALSQLDMRLTRAPSSGVQKPSTIISPFLLPVDQGCHLCRSRSPSDIWGSRLHSHWSVHHCCSCHIRYSRQLSLVTIHEQLQGELRKPSRALIRGAGSNRHRSQPWCHAGIFEAKRISHAARSA